jgi:hypothetical protein
MATEPKMVPTTADVTAFIDAVSPVRRRTDAHALVELMEDVTGEPPTMWGPSIVGFGSYRYRYDSGRTGEAPLAAFAPRKANLVVYLTSGFADTEAALLARLGPHRTSTACLYLTRLDAVDLGVLRQLVERAVQAASDTAADDDPPAPG